MIFYTGLHMPNHAKYFDKSFISINRLIDRKSDFTVNDWIMDSGAFTRLATGKGHLPIDEYCENIKRWSQCGNLKAAVCQDWMCEDFILDKTGLCIGDHQALTIENYVELSEKVTETYIMPVLQGFEPDEYVEHIDAYGHYLKPDAWCGVGSICKRNSNPSEILSVLKAILRHLPKLRIHGFGLKKTALKHPSVASLIYSADSMAWSYAARANGGGQNDYREALKFGKMIKKEDTQIYLFNNNC